MTIWTSLRARTARSASLLTLPALMAACATPPPPLAPYRQPPPGPDVAEVELRLMPRSRNRSAALYMAGAVRCNAETGIAKVMLGSKIEAPAEIIARSEENPRGWPKVRLPAGQMLPLRFRYFGPGEEYVVDVLVTLTAGASYVFDHEIPGRGVTLVDRETGLPPLSLPPKVRRDAVTCP